MPSLKQSSAAKPASKSPKNSSQFRIGKVQGYLRGSVWYLYYHEQGQPRRPRVGPDLEVVRQMAAQINSQLETEAPAARSFEAISIVDLRDRWLPIEHVRPIVLLTEEQQVAFLKACDDWQFPVYLTLLLTGLRPGELMHLLLPEDLDFDQRLLFVRNQINLGWQVKTRNERTIPLLPCLAGVLKYLTADRDRGPVFVRRQFQVQNLPSWANNRLTEIELSRRIIKIESEDGDNVTRIKRSQLSRGLWNEMGIVETDRIRTEYMRLTKAIGQPELTAPKSLRHLFATALQDANVDL